MFTSFEKSDISALAGLPLSWDKLKNSTVLISGGSGFIGSNLIAVLEERNRVYGDNIKVISLSRRSHEGRPNVAYLSADITLPIEVGGQIDFIVHLASNTHPKQYATDPVGTITTNVIGCNNLLELAQRKNVKRFLLASSVEIYGNGTDEPMTEDYCGYINCNTARSGYNEAKRVSESLCQSYISQYGSDCVIARLARVFGASRNNDTKAIAQFMGKAVGGENIVLKSKGAQRFSYCYVADAVGGLLKVLLDGVKGEAYNISADDEGLTLGDYAKYIASLAGKEVVFDLDNVQQGASAAAYALLDCAKLKSLGWKPLYTVRRGLERTYEILSSEKTVL